MKNTLCYLCKKNKGDIANARRGDKCYYICTSCNNTRSKAYYNSKKGNLIVKKLLRKYYCENKTKVKARSKLNYEVIMGRVKKPKDCTVCLKYVKRIQAHHKDYSKPLEVIWLCGKCHWKIDHPIIKKV